jgi:RHS repeat-associated protein
VSTGLDYFGARYFSGAQGRFTTPDPDNAGSYPDDPQSWNAYSYGRNNPLRFTDPDGLNYRVCDTQGHCRDVTDDEWNKWREAQGKSIIVTAGGNILDRETEKKIGSSQYYNEKLAEALQEAGNRADVLIKDAAKRMAVDAVVGGVGGAVLGQFAPRIVEFAVSKLPVNRVFPALARLSPKILRQMQTRGWTRAQIQEAFESGESFPAVNRLRGGTSATRYVHPTTGKAVTIDNATGEVIQVGGAGFTYTHY